MNKKLNKKGECPSWKLIIIFANVLLILVVLSVVAIDKYDLKERLVNISQHNSQYTPAVRIDAVILSAIEENGENIVTLNENLMEIARSLEVLQQQHVELNNNLHIINDKIKIIGGMQNE